jgi:hypothetical protein
VSAYPAHCAAAAAAAASSPAVVVRALRGSPVPEYHAGPPGQPWPDITGDGVADGLTTEHAFEGRAARITGFDGRDQRVVVTIDAVQPMWVGPKPARVGPQANSGVVFATRELHDWEGPAGPGRCRAGALHAVDATGRTAWSIPLVGASSALPVFPGSAGGGTDLPFYAVLDGAPGKPSHVAAITSVPGARLAVVLIDGATGAVKTITVPAPSVIENPTSLVAHNLYALPDITGDGRHEFQVSTSASRGTSVFNVHDGETGLPLWRTTTDGWVVTGVRAAGDLNGDGRGELALRRRLGEGWTVHDGQNGAALWHAEGDTFFGRADADGDGVSEPVAVDLLNNGTARFRRYAKDGSLLADTVLGQPYHEYQIEEDKAPGVRALGDVDGDVVEDYYHRGAYGVDQVVSGRTFTPLWSPEGARVVVGAVPGRSPLFLDFDRPDQFRPWRVTALDGLGRVLWTTATYAKVSHGKAVAGGGEAQDVILMVRGGGLVSRHTGMDGKRFWELHYSDGDSYQGDDCVWCE